jgi:hypothetical protein
MVRLGHHSCALALLIGVGLAPSIHAEERFLSFLFGPGSPETARRGAHAAADAARRWFQTPGAVIEVRRAGSPDAQSVDPQMGPKELEQAFAEVAAQARDADPASFLTALDAAVQAAALRPGTRLLVAVLNSPPLSSEAERTLEHLVDICRAKGMHVIVLDIAEGARSVSNAAFENLAKRTGGLWLREAKALEPDVMMVAPTTKAEPAAQAAAEPAQPPSAAAPSAPAAGPRSQFEIPVYTRFIRTSGTGSVSSGVFARALGSADAKGSPVLVANASTGPLKGLLLVESPLSSLKFETDASAGTYLARARVTAMVRNSKGVAVWSGSKETNIRGPLRKLDTRQQGGLYFMRELSLLSGDSYTLEAKVEDLVAGSSGTTRTPLRTGAGAPGLMASDALAVRRFAGSADKFEADQVFSYEGEALAPVLHPVFNAGERINLRLFFVIYPDINGPQPDMNLELVREGHAVARVPIQFKTQVRGSEFASGASGPGAADATGGHTIGNTPIPTARAREFPYLASVSGAKLSPGNYEAVVTIRQGGSVITRTVAFKVAGNASAVAETAGGPRAASGGDFDPEGADVVLPEIAPATLDSSGLAMGAEEQKRLWEEAAKNVLGYSSHLPNFRCTQETRRFAAPMRTPDLLKETDSFKDELTYEGGKESYRRVELNGAKVETAPLDSKGVHSRGEFGSMLMGLFDPAIKVSYKWAGRAMAMGVLCQVFELEVVRATSNFTLDHNGRREPVGYTGRIFIDEDTGLVRRLTIVGVGLPKDFGLQSPTFSLEYGMVRIGSNDYLLPLRSILQLRLVRSFVRNETVFRGYRKFEASSEVKFEKK